MIDEKSGVEYSTPRESVVKMLVQIATIRTILEQAGLATEAEFDELALKYTAVFEQELEARDQKFRQANPGYDLWCKLGLAQ